MRLKKLLSVVVATGMITASLVGCSSSNGDGGSDGGASGSKDTLTVAVSAEPATLDPLGKNDSSSSNLKQQIFDTLLVADGDQVVGGVMDTFEWKDDLTLVLTLREGIKFHNGDPLTVEDIMYSLEKSAESEFTQSKVAMIDYDKTKIIDEKTIEVALKEPYPILPTELTLIYAMPKNAIESAGMEKFAEAPIGTGPFKFESWTRGDRIELATNTEYWGAVPEFSKLVWRTITESSSRTIEVESGGVDVAFNIVPNDVARLEENDKVNLYRSANYSTAYIAFNNKIAPFDNALVRQALSYAIDKEAIVQAVYNGVGKVGTGPLPATVFGYEENVTQYEYNPEKAKELLKEAGVGDGIEIVITTSDSQVRTDTAEILQNQLNSVGIKARVDVLENATYLDKVVEGSLQMFILGWTVTSGDAAYGLEPFYTASPSWSNTSFYSNPEVDKLLDQAKVEQDENVRKDLYSQAQKLIAEEAPIVFLQQGEEVYATTSNVEGVKVTAANRFFLNEVKFK